MPVPLRGGDLTGAVLHDADANPISSILDGTKRRLCVDAQLTMAANVAIDGVIQVQNIETTAALGGGASFTGGSRDLINYQGFGVSVFIERLAANTNVDVIVENSNDGVTWRTQDTVNLAVTPANPTRVLNRVYDVTRQFMRVRLVNNTANALMSTELTTMQKPI